MTAGPDLGVALAELRRATYGSTAIASVLVAVREVDELPPELAAVLENGWCRGGLETALVELLARVDEAADRIDHAVSLRHEQQPDAAGGGRR